MNKKNTIIIAVLINAALLTLLFITASSHEEEYYAKAHIPKAPIEKPLEMVAPVLEAESISAKPEESGVPIPIAAIPEVSPVPIAAQEVKPIYPLPEVAKESAPIVAATPVHAPIPAAPKLKEVIVKKGDSLDKIARANKVRLDEIVKINQLPNSFLKIGQVLKIPEASQKTASTPKAEAKDTSTQFYVVKAGDNPWTIAMKHHMKVEELLKINHLDKDKAKKLKPGDKLKVK